ncbi:hypothetical protein D7X98_04395 [bacterium 1XD8-76]|nr:hypothetical protein D7X98_04395 [bacterium 1XD8-76]
MSKKIVCESCGTIFPFEKAKDFTVCPVCNASFDDEENEASSTNNEKEEIDLEHPDMYFYSIDSEDKYENKNLRDIWCQCTTCREVNTIPYNYFYFVTSEYVKLKDDVEIRCEECGKVVTNPVIPKRPDGWRELDMWKKDYDNLPKCPICHSTKIHKISMTNKAAFALAFGVFAVGHVSKTYKCDICGSKF